MTDLNEDTKRGPGRPSIRASETLDSIRPQIEDHAKRAQDRLAEIRSSGIDMTDDSNDDFSINSGSIPVGWSYEWKTQSVFGKEDPYYLTEVMRKGGWSPVPASRHPELCPIGYNGNNISKKGLILMERPLILTQEARNREAFAAMDAVRQKVAQFGERKAGNFDGGTFAETKPIISKNFAPAEIPA